MDIEYVRGMERDIYKKIDNIIFTVDLLKKSIDIFVNAIGEK